MFHFPEFPSVPINRDGSPDFHQGEFPHSDTAGSTFVDNSPTYFAVCCVLLRLQPPRHPPFALFKFSIFPPPNFILVEPNQNFSIKVGSPSRSFSEGWQLNLVTKMITFPPERRIPPVTGMLSIFF